MIDSPNDPTPTIDRSRPITRAWMRGAATVGLLVAVGVGIWVHSVAISTPAAPASTIPALQNGFSGGVKLVPSDVEPGTYVTTSGRVEDCYWERSADGVIIDNNFVSGASKVTVTIEPGDDAFTSHGCGYWVRVSS